MSDWGELAESVFLNWYRHILDGGKGTVNRGLNGIKTANILSALSLFPTAASSQNCPFLHFSRICSERDKRSREETPKEKRKLRGLCEWTIMHG